MRWKPVLWTGGGLLAAFLMLRLAIRFISPRPVTLGPVNGHLADCPDSPNCVCSHAKDEEHAFGPLPFSGSAAAARDRLKAAVSSLSGARMIRETDNYLYYEFTTPLMGFVDDVEFLLDADSQTVHCRSASRLGYSDLGVNRNRMEAIRRKFEAAGT